MATALDDSDHLINLYQVLCIVLNNYELKI